jgi:hypothetical protein
MVLESGERIVAVAKLAEKDEENGVDDVPEEVDEELSAEEIEPDGDDQI